MRWVTKSALYALLFGLYLVSTVPVGLFIYSIKNTIGIDFLKDGGYHAYMRCLRASLPPSKPSVLPKHGS